MGDTLLIEPESSIPSSTLFKYVMAHEFGHFIQANGQGMIGHDYDATLGLAQPKVCTCDLARADDSLHCLQSVEEPSSAGAEGFGQYFASKVWNRDGEENTFGLLPGAEKLMGPDSLMAGAFRNAGDTYGVNDIAPAP